MILSNNKWRSTLFKQNIQSAQAMKGEKGLWRPKQQHERKRWTVDCSVNSCVAQPLYARERTDYRPSAVSFCYRPFLWPTVFSLVKESAYHSTITFNRFISVEQAVMCTSIHIKLFLLLKRRLQKCNWI